MPNAFVHLHLHTEYSLVDGLVRVKPLMQAVAAAGMPAVAITDQGNLFAMVKFYRAAMAQGIKPIIGVDAWISETGKLEDRRRLVLLCQNNTGYGNLCRLISRSYQRGQERGVPILHREWLVGATEGLIALSGGPTGVLGDALRAGRIAEAVEAARFWNEQFPDRFYLQVQRTGRAGDEDHLHGAVKLAAELQLPVVAGNDVHFLSADDFEAHEARVCIYQGHTLDDKRRPREHSAEQYLRTPEEMVALFADLPQALQNSVEIARRCSVDLTLGENFLPAFPIPDGWTETDWFIKEARDGLEERLAFLFDVAAPEFAAQRRVYDERLQIELDVIINMGFPGYFLIVADFIQWAKHNAIPVGPGRGSGAGSLVAYAMKITDLDPIEYDLLFERFLNPERVSLPDFDVDFCMEGRDRVIDYVARHYGKERVSQIITYGSMAAKAVVRDVGRVLGHPFGFVDRIAKLIPFDLGITLEKALAQEPELKRQYEQEEDVTALIDLALKLEGVARNAGKHAGGVVIAPSVLTDFCPLYCEEGGEGLVSQYDKDDVEAVGLVKFDFLGLRTLTIIDWALTTTNRMRKARDEAPVEIERIPLDDKKTYQAIIKSAMTTAVFQLESRGMKDLIRRLQPDCFEDIIALVALFRPGPLQSGMVDDFINRKHGRAKVEYPHPDLEPILKPTYGVILYQEQVMQIAQVLAGYTLGGADMLRRAMGKKKPEVMAEQRDIFLSGAAEREIDAKTANYIFDLMEKFAGYGFNKSHSAAYALVSYQTAWMKAHHPAPFMAAVMSADLDNTDKIKEQRKECAAIGLEVLPPDVNHSDYRFTVPDEKTVRWGLGAIKGVGEAAIDGVMRERENGAYRDLFDFCLRVDTGKLNRRSMEALVRAGALDSLGANRATLMATLTEALQAAEQSSRNAAAGQDDLFGAGATVTTEETRGYQHIPDWQVQRRLSGEEETLGVCLSGHFIDAYRAEIDRFTAGSIARIKPTRPTDLTVAGIVENVRTIDTRRGRMAVVMLEDPTGSIEAAVFADVYERVAELLRKKTLLVIKGEAGPDERNGGYSIKAADVYPLDVARTVFGKRLKITVDAQRAANGFVDSLQGVLKPHCNGSLPVWIGYAGAAASAELRLGEAWRVTPSDELLDKLARLAGEDGVELQY